MDARFLQPDLPIDTPPKFQYNPDKIHCVPVNALAATTRNATTSDDAEPQPQPQQYYVIVGAGKTGMDALLYLLETNQTKNYDNTPNNILWIMPCDVWITARENMGNCMEFLRDALVGASGKNTITTTPSSNTQRQEDDNHDDDAVVGAGGDKNKWIQDTYLQWEQQGKVYRLDSSQTTLPTKFRDATLSKDELWKLQQVPTIRGSRIAEIRDNGDMVMVNTTTSTNKSNNGGGGRVVSLPWGQDAAAVQNTTFVHCSAGAFHYTKQQQQQYENDNDDTSKANNPCGIFRNSRTITIMEVYGTPGFCFNGALIGFLEALGDRLTDDDKDYLTTTTIPTPATADAAEQDSSSWLPLLGPSGGDVDIGLIKNYVQRLSNLRKWLQVPELADWLVGNRLFNLGDRTANELTAMVDETWQHVQNLNLAV